MSDDLFQWRTVEEKERAYIAASELAQNNFLDFWRKESKRLTWQTSPSQTHEGDFANSKWFIDGKINACENCLDRHINAGQGNNTAVTFESESGETTTLSYTELHKLTCDIATNLTIQGINKGDRVAIYLPMTPYAVASMLACARIGAIHTVVFAGFSKDSLCDRIHDSEVSAVITAANTVRKGIKIDLIRTVEAALDDKRASCVKTVLFFGETPQRQDKRFIAFNQQLEWPKEVTYPQGFNSEHPLFILYTSGTTGKPKGIFHSTGGYLTQTISTTKWVFDLTKDDLFWCTADVGWVTGHTYLTYGPLMLGANIFIYEGALNFPSPSRIYELIDKHGVSVLYTAPTAIRMFMGAGEKHKAGHHLSTLRLLGSVGEPINPEAWSWYRRVFGNDRCPIVDTWWQTETGAMMLAPIPGISNQKPGSAATPVLGISSKIVDDAGTETSNPGILVIDKPWPSMARGIWNDQDRFLSTYFSQFPGLYFSGDGAKKDADGDYFISGRIDDVVNVSGHRLGTAEVESALVAHKNIAEAAVVGVPDKICGQALYAFVTLMSGIKPYEELESELKLHVRNCIGAFAKPKRIVFHASLPKTRSGKIMRRLLRSIASGKEVTSDLSTLEDMSSISPIRQ